MDESPADEFAEAGREAAAIAAGLRRLAPQDGGPEAVAACERALQLLEPRGDPQLTRELQLRLGSYLLERRDADRPADVARARELYHAVLDSSERDNDPLAWESAVVGYANSLAADPAAAPDRFGEAFELLDALVARLRGRGDPERLAVTLNCYSTALLNAPVGDHNELLERAIVLQRDAIAALGSAERNPPLWGRVHHNLARLYLERRLGVSSQNVDLAVAAGREALRVRTRESDPVGRARTLRGLALALREWSGADSQAQADALADMCLAEANEIARADPRAAPRPGSWGSFAAERSALNVDLDEYMRRPAAEAVPLLEAAIANHRSVLQGIAHETAPAEWANWQGGLGHLLAKLGHFQRADAIQEAYQCFVAALDAITPASNPRLFRDISRAMGELCHQIGAWQCSLPGYANALALSDRLFDEAAAPESRHQELADMRGFALFAAYAATRLGKLEAAVELAESGRSRSLVEALAAAEIATSGAPAERRGEVAAASRRVAALEADLRRLRADDAHGIMEALRARLADYLGADPRLINVRVTNPGPHELDIGAEYLRVSSELREARAALRATLTHARAERQAALPKRLGAADISGVAAQAGFPIAYVFATVWGGAALIVPPAGPIDHILLDRITSDVTGALLHGHGDGPGYADGAMNGDEDALAATLPEVLETLAATVVQPIVEWLNAHGHGRAILIPLGKLGLFPLHAAVSDVAPVLSYAPSARALSRALALGHRAGNLERTFLGVADPSQSVPSWSLPFAVAEVRSAAGASERWSRTTVLTAHQATSTAVAAAAAGATHLHFACHGLFRPSDPMASALLLTGEDRITLGALLQGDVDFSAAQLAVLSACQTANTDFRTLPDEVLGLPSGLVLAGVPRVVSTMWLIYDRAAAFFCQRLYEELFVRGAEPAVAVSAAQRWLRDATAEELQDRLTSLRAALPNDEAATDEALVEFAQDLAAMGRDERPFAAPEYWAGFAYTGV